MLTLRVGRNPRKDAQRRHKGDCMLHRLSVLRLLRIRSVRLQYFEAERIYAKIQKMADIKKGHIFFDDNPYADTNPVPPKPVKAWRDGVFCVAGGRRMVCGLYQRREYAVTVRIGGKVIYKLPSQQYICHYICHSVGLGYVLRPT